MTSLHSVDALISSISLCSLFKLKGELQVPNSQLKSIERQQQGYEAAKREFIACHGDGRSDIKQLISYRSSIFQFFKDRTITREDNVEILIPRSEWTADTLAFFIFQENPKATLEDVGQYLYKKMELSLWLDEHDLTTLLNGISIGVGYRMLLNELCEYAIPAQTRFGVDHAFKFDISSFKEDAWKNFTEDVIKKLLMDATVSDFNRVFTDKRREQKAIVNKLVWKHDLQLLSYYLNQLNRRVLRQRYVTQIAEKAFVDVKGNLISSKQLSKPSARSKIPAFKRSMIDGIIDILTTNMVRQ